MAALVSTADDVEYFRLFTAGMSVDIAECAEIGDSRCSTLMDDRAALGAPDFSVDVSDPCLSWWMLPWRCGMGDESRRGEPRELRWEPRALLAISACRRPRGSSYLCSKRHSRPNFWHCAHFGTWGSQRIFFSRQVLHACPRRFLGLPAFVVPHLGFTLSPLTDFGQCVWSL